MQIKGSKSVHDKFNRVISGNKDLDYNIAEAKAVLPVETNTVDHLEVRNGATEAERKT